MAPRSNNAHIKNWNTCFSKALGTSLLSSDRLWLIRSRRLFSMICAAKRRDGQSWSFTNKQKKPIPHKLLTPRLFFRARICDVLLGDMEPVTGLTEREKGEEAGRGEDWHKDTWCLWSCCILLALPALILHRHHGTSAPPNLICLLGRKQGRNAPRRDGRTRLFWFHAFLDISLSEVTCCSPFNLSENSLREMIVWPPGSAFTHRRFLHAAWDQSSAKSRHSIWIVFVCSLSSYRPDSSQFPPNCPTRGQFTFY